MTNDLHLCAVAGDADDVFGLRRGDDGTVQAYAGAAGALQVVFPEAAWSAFGASEARGGSELRHRVRLPKWIRSAVSMASLRCVIR